MNLVVVCVNVTRYWHLAAWESQIERFQTTVHDRRKPVFVDDHLKPISNTVLTLDFVNQHTNVVNTIKPLRLFKETTTFDDI